MASLRARVLASVLLLAAAGLWRWRAVTYTEQRSFLEGRLDQQVRGAGPVRRRSALDHEGFTATPTTPNDNRAPAAADHGGTGAVAGRPDRTCPPAPTASAAKPPAR